MLPGEPAFGELEMFGYDDASLTKARRRDRVLETVQARRDGWQRTYHPYRDASFRIEEQVNREAWVVISGMKNMPQQAA